MAGLIAVLSLLAALIAALAVQEQLGLTLERRSVTTDVVVVDHIERPSPD